MPYAVSQYWVGFRASHTGFPSKLGMGCLALCSQVVTFCNCSLPLVNFRRLRVTPKCTLNLCSSLSYRVFTFKHCSSSSALRNSFSGFITCECCLFIFLYFNLCWGCEATATCETWTFLRFMYDERSPWKNSKDKQLSTGRNPFPAKNQTL